MVNSTSSSNSEIDDPMSPADSPLPLIVKTTMNNDKNNNIVIAKGGTGLGGTLLCKWEDCIASFTNLIDLVSHLHEEHVGRKKAAYTCEWAGCPRKSKTQTSRFALITHLRSHTGEKPFTCEVKGCGKKFTRPDSLTKHMKSQHEDTSDSKKKHNMDEIIKHTSYKKRRVDDGDNDNDSNLSSATTTTTATTTNEGSTANVSSSNHHGQDQQKSYHEKYLILKAKHRYIRRENELLIDEYQAIKKKLKRLRTEKDILLDAVMTQIGDG
ncbi:8449_t:CDS:2 [Ambispora leptoticha]|uniref:8448_t:CDS:1 n=1 Tax=Ambispora leptoticha TaxID=144679 RepID=A0A9N8VT02_9GLOM|nr:8448_t:CDS:2 [Ambispora leptoticha]CAG8461401.1 8449_t:CDS:2 [Ambispora leptoticha]